ncbi:hypothetical protein SS1G_01529 [Sclerotinia sclerotiorum 1980 UF-70]|uniref:DNA topoisomerase (ATP-hydrolyzing) n=1 Tax=Sclerotinia sclerotiorum (strain ATCC 18683 / 1980 / Ss-1) TaxID=665079 RepID=A7E8A1_SCLS1|nr:hypothetical protein SS1G_01529 [Sclerotinia sclerotiorum 1980 UF-70]EDN96603.1 hypothetical protein SS1G_01529 [Sclerotinia sclerotiorum 1980 UF-70]
MPPREKLGNLVGWTALLRIVTLSHEALVTGNIITKRDMYYRDPELFTKQAIVDRFVDDIAYTLGLKRDAMNVSQLVPWVREIEEIDLSQVKWILVIEKEVVHFNLQVATSLTQYRLPFAHWKKSDTAKGYPDIQSRQFLHYLAENHPLIPIYALVDFDPDGIGIMSTYKYGSVALAHENEDLSVPSIRWLGLKSTDMMHGVKEDEGLLKLTKRDRRIAVGMLQRDVCQDGGVEKEWRRQLQIMLMLNTKAEIQVIGNGDLNTGNMSINKYIKEKMHALSFASRHLIAHLLPLCTRWSYLP